MKEPPKLNKYQERADGYTPAQEQFINSMDAGKSTLMDRWKHRTGRKSTFAAQTTGRKLPKFLDFQIINGKRVH